jgi:hypothetical protein
MAGVVVAAILLGAVRWITVMRARSAEYELRAWKFMDYGARNAIFKLSRNKHGVTVDLYDNENDWRRYAWADKLARKYFRLSTYPWLPVEPDPPPPKPLDCPRGAPDLTPEMAPGKEPDPSLPPTWTFLWTWRPRGWRNRPITE